MVLRVSLTHPVDLLTAHRRLGARTEGAGEPSQYASGRERGAKRVGLSDDGLVIGLRADTMSRRSLLERKVPSYLKKLLTTNLSARAALAAVGIRLGDASTDGGGEGNDGE